MRLIPFVFLGFVLGACRPALPPPVDAGVFDFAAGSDGGARPTAIAPPPLDDAAVPVEADPTFAALSWKAVSADGKVEWSQRLVRPGECVVTVREVGSGVVRWAAPGCIGRRTQRLHPSNDGERLLMVDAEPMLDAVDPARTVVAELRVRTALHRRWRAFVLPGDVERHVEGPRLVWLKSRDNKPSISADSNGLTLERLDGTFTLLGFDTATAPDTLPAIPEPPGCPTGPCRWTDDAGQVFVVGEPADVPARFRSIARSVALERAVEASGTPEAPAPVPVPEEEAVEADAITAPSAPVGSPSPRKAAVEPEPEPEPEAPAPTTKVPDHFDRVRSMLGLPAAPENAPPPPPPGARCELRTDPATGIAKTVCE